MYLNTLGKHELYQSLAEIMNTTEECIEQYIIKKRNEIVGNRYEDISIQSMSLEKLMENAGCKKLNLIDKVIIHHITPRKDISSVYTEGILTLPHALTQDTVLADYLGKLGFSFEFMDNQVIMKKNNEIVDLSKLNFSNLHVRFGNNCTVNDFNVNGYLFVDNFKIDRVRGWLGSPEILKSIATAYGNRSIADNYANHCKNYLVSFEVSTDNIDLENFSENIEAGYKTELLVKYAVMALAYFEIKKKPILPMYNPIIYLKRDYDVPGSDIREVWKLIGNEDMVIPEKYEI